LQYQIVIIEVCDFKWRGLQPAGFDFSSDLQSSMSDGDPQAKQLAEKIKVLSFRGALRAEESLFLWHSITERFLASLGMTK
jgi:hypothetical protein